MQYDLISDIHIDSHRGCEFDFLDGKKSDILIVAGDTSNHPTGTIYAWSTLAQHYKQVLVVDGNHDHYNKVEYRKNINSFRATYDYIQNVFFLPDYFLHIGDTLFIGDNGWYDWNGCETISQVQEQELWKTNLNDYKFITFGNVWPDKLAKDQARILASYVDRAQAMDSVKNIVVTTHTVPHPQGVVPMNHPWYPLNGSFFNSQMKKVWEADRNKKIKVWNFGHTHFLYDFIDNDIRFVSNPRGYRNEGNGFKGLITIDV